VDRSNLFVAAENEISPAAELAGKTMAAVPTYSDALSRLPVCYIGADGVDSSGDFMTGNSGILNAWEKSFLDEDVAVTNSTGFHLDANLVAAGIGDISFDKFEAAAGFCNLHCFHASHFYFPERVR
jgi:hypothetical protein